LCYEVGPGDRRKEHRRRPDHRTLASQPPACTSMPCAMPASCRAGANSHTAGSAAFLHSLSTSTDKPSDGTKHEDPSPSVPTTRHQQLSVRGGGILPSSVVEGLALRQLSADQHPWAHSPLRIRTHGKGALKFDRMRGHRNCADSPALSAWRVQVCPVEDDSVAF
jgi:hypothetical protein